MEKESMQYKPGEFRAGAVEFSAVLTTCEAGDLQHFVYSIKN